MLPCSRTTGMSTVSTCAGVEGRCKLGMGVVVGEAGLVRCWPTGAPQRAMCSPEGCPAQPGALRLRGSALLALAQDEMPAAEDLASLRRLMRALIRHQLGGGELRSWAMLAG